MDTRIFWRECRSLSKAGFEVYVAAHHVPVERFDRVRFVELPASLTRFKLLTQPYRAVAFLRKLNGDIYHFHDPDLLLVAGLISKSGKITIYDCHEWYHEVFPYKGYHPLLTKAIRFAHNVIEKQVLRNLSAVITPTDELAAVYGGKAKITAPILNLPPLELPEGDFPDDIRQEYDLIHVGTLSKPRLSFMLDVVRELHSRGCKATLLLLGVSTELKDWIQGQDDIAGFVTGMERVPGNQVPRILRTARIGLNYHPYQPRFMVAIPMKLFEYMRYGLPFVSSALPPLKRLLGETGCGILVDNNDVMGFADAILSLLNNEQLLSTMGKHCEELVHNTFNWEAEASKLIKLYSILVKDGM
jgi:glycosyltransferase involved in cell wall biosynthesis